MIKVTVVTTFKNEAQTIAPFIEGLLSQSRSPDEIVLCDGGSTDGTIEIIQQFIDNAAPIKLVIKPGNRSVGRNEATKQASNEHIAVTDVGTVADKDWLKNIIAPFENDSSVQAVSGFFKTKSETFFEEVSSQLMLVDHGKIDSETWLPSSRSVAYTKTAWKDAGGYPEYTSYNEDTPFDLALIKAGHSFTFAKEAIVYWRPRSTYQEFYKQYFNYAIGDGIDGINARNYIKKMVFYSGLLGILFLSIFIPYLFLVDLGIVILYLLWRSRHMWNRNISKKWLLYVLPVIVTYDIANIRGFVKGFFMRKEGNVKS